MSGENDASYRTLWAELARQVEAAGSHAWRFVSPSDAEVRLEFLEFQAARDPRSDPAARSLLGRLDDEIGAAAVEEWLEDR